MLYRSVESYISTFAVQKKGSVREIKNIIVFLFNEVYGYAMARRPRIEFAGAFYHVISRGDHGEAIYQDDEDRKRVLTWMGEVSGRTRKGKMF